MSRWFLLRMWMPRTSSIITILRWKCLVELEQSASIRPHTISVNLVEHDHLSQSNMQLVCDVPFDTYAIRCCQSCILCFSVTGLHTIRVSNQQYAKSILLKLEPLESDQMSEDKSCLWTLVSSIPCESAFLASKKRCVAGNVVRSFR